MHPPCHAARLARTGPHSSPSSTPQPLLTPPPTLHPPFRAAIVARLRRTLQLPPIHPDPPCTPACPPPCTHRPQGYHVARLAADLRDFLEALDLKEVTVVGCSMGAAGV